MTDSNDSPTADEDSDPTTTDGSPLQAIPWRRVANIAGLVLLIAIVLPFVIYAVPQAVGADHSYVVLSGSMEPTISPGDVVIVNSVAPSKIQQGDVITFNTGEAAPTTHRVIEVTEQEGQRTFRTKGDANEDPDRELITPDQVQGKVMSVGGDLFVIPYLGFVIQFANTQTGFVLLFVVPLVLLVLSEIWNVASASRPDEAVDDGSDSAGAETEDHDVSPEASEEEPTPSDDAITFSAVELQLGLVALLAFLAYSAWAVYAIREIWAFGVAVSVATAVLLFGTLYFAGGGDSESTETDETTVAASELRLGLVALFAFLAYSAWAAYATREGWAFGVAGSVGAAFLLLVTLYFVGRRGGSPESKTTEEPAPSATDGGTIPDEGTGAASSPEADPTEESETSGEEDGQDGDDESGSSQPTQEDDSGFEFVSESAATDADDRADQQRGETDE